MFNFVRTISRLKAAEAVATLRAFPAPTYEAWNS